MNFICYIYGATQAKLGTQCILCDSITCSWPNC